MKTPHQQIHLHGDLTLYPSNEKYDRKADKKKLHVLQSSGTTGNRHEVVCNLRGGQVSRWKNSDGKEFVYCPKPFVLQHVGGDEEHGRQDVAAGTYEIMHEYEHDPHKNELRVVID